MPAETNKENRNNKSEERKENLTDEIKDPSLEYQKGKPGEITEEQKKEMEKTRKDLDNFKNKVIKKYSFTIAIGILPPQAAEKIEEEEQVPIEEAKKKPIHILILIPEDNFKEIAKIKDDLLKEAKEIKQKIWLHIKTPVDIWNYCLDGKYDIQSAMAMAYPLHDKGFLGSLRVAEIHKSLVLRKFERYVQSYVIAGSLVRGEATKTSDVDVYCVIDDTDVKRMHRLELKEKLRNIIYQYIYEAGELAGVKNKLSIQVYILTEFWESVKDAHPVIFTFIRDGIPLYDKGTFMPWKLLLKMGKLKPSPEAIDMFMASGDKMDKSVKKFLTDCLVIDIYWGVLTPAQALLMLYGLPPPTHKETIKVFRETFVEKEKMLEKKYADILEKIVMKYKDYEHEKFEYIKGAEIDKYLEEANQFLKRLKELRIQIEKRTQEKTIEQIYSDIFNMLKAMFNKKSEHDLIASFNKTFVQKGIFPPQYLKILRDTIKARNDFKKGKLDKHEIDNARKNASQIINHLIEYNQRCELHATQKGKLRIKTKDKTYGLVLADRDSFLIDSGNVKKIDITKNKLVESNIEELTKALSEQTRKTEVTIEEKTFEVLRKELGKFDIVI